MRIVGKTTDGKPVVADVFHLYDTSGLPLSAVIDSLRKRGIVISVPHLYREARIAGWKHETVVAKFTEAYADAMGATAASHVDSSLTVLQRLYDSLGD